MDKEKISNLDDQQLEGASGGGGLRAGLNLNQADTLATGLADTLATGLADTMVGSKIKTGLADTLASEAKLYDDKKLM